MVKNCDRGLENTKIVQFMEDLAVFTAINHSGSFGKNFVKFKNNKYVIYRLRVGLYGFGQHFQDLGHSFSPYGPTLSR